MVMCIYFSFQYVHSAGIVHRVHVCVCVCACMCVRVCVCVSVCVVYYQSGCVTLDEVTHSLLPSPPLSTTSQDLKPSNIAVNEDRELRVRWEGHEGRGVRYM